jgi:predicted kinase
VTLIIPVGPPASGKSTLVKRLIESGWLDADAVVSPDAYRRILTGDHSDQSVNGNVFEICRRITAARLSNGLDVLYDATNLLSSWRTDILRAAEQHNQPVMCIMFTANNELCARRNWMREVPVPDAVMEQMFQYRREIRVTDLPGHVITDVEFISNLSWSYPMQGES